MSAAPAPASAPPRTRPKLGRYELCAEIASGGMGRVYLARALGPAGFDKLVALKCIHPELGSEPSFVEMFFDEARIAARINHPNVCSVFDFGEADGRYYLAMEYLAGESVSRILRKLQKLPKRSLHLDALAARIVADAAEGLHAAHTLVDDAGKPLEVVHRDVSPQNLFVTYDGSVRVVDFGIASAQGRLHRTATGSIKGKFAYMAPEQLRREKADARADVWALGIVLWELLTGTRPFAGATEVDLLLAVLNDPVRRPSELRPDLDPDLEAIVMGALEKDRDARTPSARELARALHRWTVARGEVVGMAELAHFMETTFPDERMRVKELLESARRTEPSVPLHLPAGSEELKSAMVPTARATPAKRRRERGWLVLGAVGVIALGAGLYALGAQSAAPAATETAATETATPPEAEPARSPPTAEPAEVAPAAATAPEVAPTAAAAPVTEEATAPPEVVPSEVASDGPAAETDPAESTGGRVRRERVTAGTLRVETPGGWADVYVDGRRLGRSPLTTELPAGRVMVELRPFGLAPLARDTSLRRSVTIGARTARIVVPIAP